MNWEEIRVGGVGDDDRRRVVTARPASTRSPWHSSRRSTTTSCVGTVGGGSCPAMAATASCPTSGAAKPGHVSMLLPASLRNVTAAPTRQRSRPSSGSIRDSSRPTSRPPCEPIATEAGQTRSRPSASWSSAADGSSRARNATALRCGARARTSTRTSSTPRCRSPRGQAVDAAVRRGAAGALAGGRSAAVRRPGQRAREVTRWFAREVVRAVAPERLKRLVLRPVPPALLDHPHLGFDAGQLHDRLDGAFSRVWDTLATIELLCVVLNAGEPTGVRSAGTGQTTGATVTRSDAGWVAAD